MAGISDTPSTRGDRERLARHYADRHFAVDPEIGRIFYLPTNAPDDEIRLLEVSGGIVATTPLEAFDFVVRRAGEEGPRLLVVDVTPGQWRDVEAGVLALPDGWTLTGAVGFSAPDR